MKIGVKQMVTMAILAALSIILMLIVRFPLIPAAPYLEYEPADVPIMIGGFIYGPVAGIIITIVASLIQAFTVSASSGWVGFVMHVIATGTLVTVSSLIYKKIRTLKGAIMGLVAGCLAMTAVMIPTNLVITVYFWMKDVDPAVAVETVKAMIFPILIPFNLMKSGINSVIVLLVYKSIRRLIQKID